jgi:hypothetical protein
LKQRPPPIAREKEVADVVGGGKSRLVALAYALVLDGQEERTVLTDKTIDVGDAVLVGDEIWLVLREADTRTATRHRARFECRRALALRTQAEELLAYTKELKLDITKAREARET